MGRTRLIRANGDSPLLHPLREILTIATGPTVILAKELAPIDGIESAFLYGSFAGRMLGESGPAPHDADVMMLGSPRGREVAVALTPLTRTQRAAVLALVEAGRLDVLPADIARATSFLANVVYEV